MKIDKVLRDRNYALFLWVAKKPETKYFIVFLSKLVISKVRVEKIT